jgi:hypothetical protein
MSALPQAIAPNPHTNLLNVYVHIANEMGLKKYFFIHQMVVTFWTTYIFNCKRVSV